MKSKWLLRPPWPEVSASARDRCRARGIRLANPVQALWLCHSLPSRPQEQNPAGSFRAENGRPSADATPETAWLQPRHHAQHSGNCCEGIRAKDPEHKAGCQEREMTKPSPKAI